jgi:hypothetical protein
VGFDTMKRLLEVAKRYRPARTKVKFRKGRDLLPAYAWTDEDGIKWIEVPRLECRDSLYIYLHECAHHHLGHCRDGYDAPLWKMEYEAEQWAIATMRREGIPVSRKMVASAKAYIRDCIKEDKKKGRPMPPARILRWCRR